MFLYQSREHAFFMLLSTEIPTRDDIKEFVSVINTNSLTIFFVAKSNFVVRKFNTQVKIFKHNKPTPQPPCPNWIYNLPPKFGGSRDQLWPGSNKEPDYKVNVSHVAVSREAADLRLDNRIVRHCTRKPSWAELSQQLLIYLPNPQQQWFLHRQISLEEWPAHSTKQCKDLCEVHNSHFMPLTTQSQVDRMLWQDNWRARVSCIYWKGKQFRPQLKCPLHSTSPSHKGLFHHSCEYHLTVGVASPSLNDCLATGPPSLPEVYSILVHFWSHPIGPYWYRESFPTC